MELIHAFLAYPFLQHALLAGLLSSLACGVMGTYVVVRRITYIAGGIAHCVLAGLGAARYFEVVHGWTWFTPELGAVGSALAAAAIIGLVSLRAREREDAVIGAVWAAGMAIGILFISRTPGYNQDLMSYLFGNILMVGRRELMLMAALDGVVLVTVLLLYRQLQAVCFDEEFARLRGLRVEVYYLVLLALTALTVVLLVSVVGIVLVIALLTIPAAMAGQLGHSLRGMMLTATGLAALFTTLGLGLSYGPDLPTGATTIMVAAVAYFALLGFKALGRG